MVADVSIPMLATKQVGQRFLEYYRTLGYKSVPGSSLLDPSVPMSFVMSAGLAQVESSLGLDQYRAGDCYTLLQNCFRYFDMDKFGISNLHLSLFQMPGAFTFGALPKQEVIATIWRLLTNTYGFDPGSLWATYFAGGEVTGHYFAPDQETYRAWLEAGLPPNHLLGYGAETNFWKQSMTVVGEKHAPKCGPCTEVFFDRGPRFACGAGCMPACRCGRFVEIQNTLFITYHIDPITNDLMDLKVPFAETVVGTERIAMILQGRASVFDIDSIRPLVDYVRWAPKSPGMEVSEVISYERLLVDRVRALLFLAADGAPSPGKGGRRFLMRRLIRGVLTSLKVLGIRDPAFIPALLDQAVHLYSDQHPLIVQGRDRAMEYIEAERHCFEKTLGAGFRKLDDLLIAHGDHFLSGSAVFDLEKRHGLPLALIEAHLRQRQADYDRDEYRATYARWRQEIVAGKP